MPLIAGTGPAPGEPLPAELPKSGGVKVWDLTGM
jgi:hypothetical protein